MIAQYQEITFSDDDFVNPEDWIIEEKSERNQKEEKGWYLFHDHGFCLCVVWADCLQDALDIAADNDKLDCFLVPMEDYSNYNADDLMCCGNDCRWFDLESLGFCRLPNFPMSIVAQFVAEFPQTVH